MKRSACKTCRAPIVWCETETGARMPLDAEPSPDGNTVVLGEVNGTPRVRVLSQIELLVDERARFKSHFATCPQAASHRLRGTRGEDPAGQTGPACSACNERLAIHELVMPTHNGVDVTLERSLYCEVCAYLLADQLGDLATADRRDARG